MSFLSTTTVKRGLALGFALGMALSAAACGGMSAQQIHSQLSSDLVPVQRAANALKTEHPVGLARLQADLTPMSRALTKLGLEIRPLASQAPPAAVGPLKRLSAATLTLASDLTAIIRSQSLLAVLSDVDQFKADEPAFEAAAQAAKKALS